MNDMGDTGLDCHAPLCFEGVIVLVIVCCILGLFWSIYNVYLVCTIKLQETAQIDLDDSEQVSSRSCEISSRQLELLLQLGRKISEGATEFLKYEYSICLVFAALMFLVICYFTADGIYTGVAFAVGAVVSIICGAVGMLIATQANFRTAYCAKRSLSDGFKTAYRAGVSMGFALVSFGLLVLIVLILSLQSLLSLQNSSPLQDYYRPLFESVAGYGLGGSFVALFGRVGGGIYTKAADVGADMVGKVESGLPEDSPRNPATIADNVGDNVGDVAGMSSDLFGSFAESSCAALVLSSTSLLGTGDSCMYSIQNFMYPLVLLALGIVCCILVSSLSTHFVNVVTIDRIEITLKCQLVISTLLLAGVLYVSAAISFPSHFKMLTSEQNTVLEYWIPYICSLTGLLSGMAIAAFTEYVTSHSYHPVQGLADACRAGPASNVTMGLALGYMSTSVPVIMISLTAYYSNKLLGFYGVSLAALGMLCNLPLSLAIDGYGPISDNAGGIAEMAAMGPEVRQRTDALDAAGNTTAAIGKGFAIGSAALVSLSLYGGFIHNANLQQSLSISMTKPEVFAGLLLGAMLPYVFSALTIRSVGKAAFGMVNQVRRQLRESPGILTGQVQPDYKACIRISTRASLIQMIAPGALVLLTPLALGFALGPVILAGFLPGAIVSGVQLAISAANTGGAWDNAKKYIQKGAMLDKEGEVVLKGSEIHRAAVVGDTVGDPLKDTSGPGLNILIKLMAILSLVFGSKFSELHTNTQN